jgi:hypothetical protein
MHEINADHVFTPSVRLDQRTGHYGSLRVDGPPTAWKLHVANHGPDPAHYGPVDGAGSAAGKVKVLKPGDSVSLSARTDLWTSGTSSLHVERASKVVDGRRVAA